MGNQLFIRLDNVSKHYNLKNDNHGALDPFYALKNIDLMINEGERVGFIGFNGAGKTTLLRIIGGFITPSEGIVVTQGKINAVMTMGLGIKEELTGIENIYVCGELYGITKKEIGELLSEITEFTDIGDYINKPVRTYSSGMKARLAFSMLSFVDPEILIIDEVLGAGDASFTAKSTAKLQELCNKGKILIIVSHSMKTIVNLTDRVIWLDNGQKRMDGDPEIVTTAYINEVARKREEKNLKNRSWLRNLNNKSHSNAIINNMEITTYDGTPHQVLMVGDSVYLNVQLQTKTAVNKWDIIVSLRKTDGTTLLISQASDRLEIKPLEAGNMYQVKIDFGELRFAEGTYELICELTSEDQILASNNSYIKIDNLTEFTLSKPDYYCRYNIVSKDDN